MDMSDQQSASSAAGNRRKTILLDKSAFQALQDAELSALTAAGHTLVATEVLLAEILGDYAGHSPSRMAGLSGKLRQARPVVLAPDHVLIGMEMLGERTIRLECGLPILRQRVFYNELLSPSPAEMELERWARGDISEEDARYSAIWRENIASLTQVEDLRRFGAEATSRESRPTTLAECLARAKKLLRNADMRDHLIEQLLCYPTLDRRLPDRVR